MSTQDSTSIPLSTAHVHAPYKLLELPPDLVALLESDSPPTLHLTPGTGTPHALLSTPTGTYRLQQKNTSNPLMLLRPSISSEAGSEGGDGADGGPGCASVCVVARIEDTLELLPYDPAAEAAAPAKAKAGKWHEKFAASRSKK
ncbi:hypothetical protein V500_08893 [Pseudogymnoascus sp. VKM F-4518 (FW-2643)]|nr:hypothetical protein V500_08893 [Pseudogymnoascus sp. VKM F-4518 (FW-2643)]